MKKFDLKKGSKIQSLHFSKEFFTKTEAKKWAKKNGFVSAKVDTTPHEFRLRQYSPTHIRIVGQSEIYPGVLAIFGFAKSGYSF